MKEEDDGGGDQHKALLHFIKMDVPPGYMDGNDEELIANIMTEQVPCALKTS